MEKYTNEYNKECYRGVEPNTTFDELEFHKVSGHFDIDIQMALHTNIGSLTVLDRMTGGGWRDIESGYRDPSGKFWLAYGNYDVRQSGAKTIQEAIDWVKKNAAVGRESQKIKLHAEMEHENACVGLTS